MTIIKHHKSPRDSVFVTRKTNSTAKSSLDSGLVLVGLQCGPVHPAMVRFVVYKGNRELEPCWSAVPTSPAGESPVVACTIHREEMPRMDRAAASDKVRQSLRDNTTADLLFVVPASAGSDFAA